MSRLLPVLTAVSWLAYLFMFPWLFQQLGTLATLCALAPVVLSAWLWKRQGGMIAAVVASALSLSHLFYAYGESASALFTDIYRRFFEACLYLIAAYLVGWVSHLRDQLGKYKRVSTEAQFDRLTGLLNRASFEQKITEAIQIGEQKETMLGVLFVDLDKFKHVNDSYGHDVGDELLKQIAKVLKSTVRQADVVARLGGDEFMLLLSELQSPGAAARIAAKIVKQVAEPMMILGKEVSVGASVGVSIFPQDGTTAQELIKRADTAMYSVKASGRNHFEVNNTLMRAEEKRQKQLEKQLQVGFDNREFELFYQPQFSLKEKKLVGFEVLLRWNSDSLGLVKPGEFLPLAESIGLLLPLDRWVLRETCHQLAQWRETNIKAPIMSVNISDVQFHQADFVEFVAKAMADHRINPALIELELSERVVSKDAEYAMHTARALMDLGVGIIIDNFGSGYASVAHLQRIPFTALKVDRSCLDRLSEDQSEGALDLLEIMAFLGRKLNKRIMAEGVETAMQHDTLSRFNYDVVQGFYYDKPIHMAEAEGLLRSLTDITGLDPEPLSPSLISPR